MQKDDVIYRQAAIEALYDWELSYTWDEHCKEDYDSPYIVSPSKVINGLPSAQPSYTDEQIQKMQELEQAEIEKAFQLGREDAQSEPQKWIDHNYYLECPSCKRYVTNRTPYCPYCGGRNE